MQETNSSTTKGKYVLITGATSGIGKVAALELAKKGASVILHGRNREKAEATKAEIRHLSGNEQVDILLADLSVSADIHRMVETFNKRYDRLDVLINNAGGVMNKQREVTVDGWEKTIALNVLAPFMLTALLYPKLIPGARVINTASAAHRMARPDLSNFMYERKYDALRAYGDAKLFVILLGQEFTRRQHKTGSAPVTMNALHPGVVATNFAGESNSFYHFFFRFFRMFLISPQKGADTLIYLAENPEVAHISGQYFSRRKQSTVHSTGNTKELASHLWALCEQYTGVVFPK